MQQFYDDAPCLYFTATDDSVLVDVNSTLCRYLHYNPNELAGKKLDLIFSLPTLIFQQTHFFPLLKMHGHAEEIYMTLQTKEKVQVPVLINASRRVVDGKALSTYAGIVVQNRKKFEDELVAAKKAAEKALRENTALLEAKNELQEQAELLDRQINLVKKQNAELVQFNHVVTHELQEPLRKLFVFTSMLLEKENEDTGKRATQKIRTVAEQMRSILSGLQQYIWLMERPAGRRSINLNELLTEIVADLQKSQPEVTIDLIVEKLPAVVADREQIRFLLQEICTNAVRFRKDDGAVTIRVGGNELQQNKFRNVAGRYHFTSFLKMQIQDNGLGFDPAYSEQAFNLFRRLHRASGRGVGLALCKKIVENHDGTIQLDSRAGEGTTVTILLPLLENSTIGEESTQNEDLKINTGNGG